MQRRQQPSQAAPTGCASALRLVAGCWLRCAALLDLPRPGRIGEARGRRGDLLLPVRHDTVLYCVYSRPGISTLSPSSAAATFG